MQAMKNWHKSHPHLFIKSPRNHPGRDLYEHFMLDDIAARTGMAQAWQIARVQPFNDGPAP
jgi:hypothetical protein